MKKYEAFGSIVSYTGQSANNRLANTKERDYSTGLDNHGMRYYDKETGSYISRDPLGYASGTMNLYSYVGNNPINRIDPLGLQGWREWLKKKAQTVRRGARAAGRGIVRGARAAGRGVARGARAVGRAAAARGRAMAQGWEAAQEATIYGTAGWTLSESEKAAIDVQLAADLGLVSAASRRKGRGASGTIEVGASVSGQVGVGAEVGASVVVAPGADVPADVVGITLDVTKMASWTIGWEANIEAAGTTAESIHQRGGKTDEVGGEVNVMIPTGVPSPLQPQVQAGYRALWGEGYTGGKVSFGVGETVPIQLFQGSPVMVEPEVGTTQTYAVTAGDVGSAILRGGVEAYDWLGERILWREEDE